MALNLTEKGSLAIRLPKAANHSGLVRPEGGSRVLVTDADVSVCTLIGAALERQGYEVHLASSGQMAIETLERNSFDLLLTDLVMQDGDGIALLEHMHLRQPNVPVIVVTAIHDIGVAIDVMRRGAYDYLLKPFERDRLLSAVLRALQHSHSLRERDSYQHSLEQVVQARTEMLRQAMDDLENSYDITLEALGDALDLKDSETEGHSKRVTAFTIALARAMGLSAAEIKIIARGAFLHDIGKMAIPDSILCKPGKLTPDEQVIMREHCARGYHMLRKIPFLKEASEIVFSHQEHFDGSGYPRQLRGEQIPIGSRIFALADTLDAITSDRPYRKAQSFDAAREEIMRCSGTQFDPEVVEVFLMIPSELWRDLRLEITSQNKRFSSFSLAQISSTSTQSQ